MVGTTIDAAAIAGAEAVAGVRYTDAERALMVDSLQAQVDMAVRRRVVAVDAMIGPCFAGPMLTITNFTGHPCLTLRAGFRQSPTRKRLSLAEARLDQGEGGSGAQFRVPHAISLWGRLFDEGTVLRIGAALETRFGVAAERPPLDD